MASSPPLGLQQEEHRGEEEACSSFTDKCRFQSSNKIDLTKKENLIVCFCFGHNAT